ncbi:cysteine hydrolase family protein [Pseudonocardia ailaonensis]|uniref:Cysteine hydrolase family protein n=1 Tax=Pseudonocardia ailaonensis TaxID=367279 RepID=A0ABN2MMZ8_9PSEU
MDVQEGVVGSAWRRDEVVGRISGLVDSARAAGVPVVWVQHEDEEMPVGSAEWAIVGALEPTEGEERVGKRYGDSFADTRLGEVLGGLGVDRFVLCGAQTDVCITSTMYGGLHRGYDVTLAEDAHTTEDTRFGGAELPAELLVAHLVRAATFGSLPGRRWESVPAAQVSWS